MAISNYVRPHLEVHQMLKVTEQSTNDKLAACVVGANYALYRYGQEDLEPYTFSSEGTTVPFEFEQQPGYNYDVDLASVTVNAEGLEASLATFSNNFKVDTKNIMGIRLTNGNLLASVDNTGLDPALEGLSVAVGDVANVTATADDGVARRRVVTGLLGKINPAKIEAGTATGTGIVIGTNVAANADATFTGSKDTTYVLQVVAVPTADSWDGVQLKVADTTGVDTAAFITLAADALTGVAVGTKGLSLDFSGTPTGIAVNDTFSFICYTSTESTTQFDGVVLEALPIDLATFDRAADLATVEFRKVFTGTIPSVNTPEESWTATAAGVEFSSDISLYIPDRQVPYIPFVDGVGSLYISYRVLIIPVGTDEDIYTIASVEDIQNYFGTIDPANELAYGCYCALEGAAGRAIYALRTAGTDAAAFRAAVKKTEADSATYSFAVLTDAQDVMEEVVAFNQTQSTAEMMKWRRTILGVDSPGEYVVATSDSSEQTLRAAIAADTDGKFTILQISEDNTFSFTNLNVNGSTGELHRGDKIEILATGAKYTVAAVLSDKEVLLAEGPASAVTVATPIAVWKADTVANTSEYVASIARGFNNRRALVVWCDKGYTSDGTILSNKFLAAEIAGLSSAVVPQQGITRFEIVSITRAPSMYTQYTQLNLDNIAREGVMIVTQNVKNGPCFIRHQLTTETDKGSLYFEDSCTRNLDNISYAIADVLDKYIGKANVTAVALRRIELEVRSTLNGFQSDTTDELVGPSLIRWENLTVVQDSTFKDRVIVNVDLYLPAPLNVIKFYSMAYVADVTLAE